jgi:aspartyl-tRNA(Asn)/glutamyl-tRNA(Gln) amidotransferase subunit C
MSLTREQVRHVATLARLYLTPEEEVVFAQQLSVVLGHIEELSALDVTGVPAMTHASTEPTLYRDDVVVPGFTAEQAVQNAPAHSGTSVAVPRIID